MEDVIINNRKAGFWVRFAATWIDILVICLLLKISVVALEQFGVFDNFEHLAVLCVIAYLAIFIAGKGRTIGKILCGLTVRQTKNRPIGYLRGLLREVVGKLIAGIFFFLGFFWAGFFRSKRGWHDYIARTIVEQDVRAIKRSRWILTVILAISILFVISKVGLFFLNISTLQKKNVLRPDAVDVSSLTKAHHKPFVAYLKANGKPPIEYVVDKFKQHDVVILGEPHQVKEVCEFVSQLIEPAYHQGGVRYLAMEVFKYKNTALANQIVTGESYDEESALQLLRDCGWPEWGFQEYIDILKAVWQVNQKLPPEAEKFKVVCMESDWDGSVLRTGKSLWKLPGIFYRMATRDKFMAKVLDWTVVKKGKKVLVHVGANHDFTHYRQAVARNGELIAEVSPRFGYILYEKYGERIFQVCLHYQHTQPEELTRGDNSLGTRQPLGGLLEEMFVLNDNIPVGFDVVGSPFASLRDNESYYFTYQKYVVFSDIARGYVLLKTMKQLHGVSWADGFVNKENFEQWEDFLCRRGKIKKNECQTPEELNKRMKLWHDEKMKQR